MRTVSLPSTGRLSSNESAGVDVRALIVADQLRRAVPGGIGTYIRGLVQGLAQLGYEGPDMTLWASRPGPGKDDVVAGLGHGHVVSSRLRSSALVWACMPLFMTGDYVR